MKGKCGKLEMPVVRRREKFCRYHEGHKRVVGNGSNWHRKRRQLCDREKMRTYIIDKYGLKAWHGD